jgi:Glucodextranase, domain B
MSTRRPARPAHVRPRPPSTGRPRPTTARPRSSAHGHVPLRAATRRAGLPIATRLLLASALVVLVAAVGLVAAGGLSVVVRSLGSAVGGVVGAIAATPKPSVTPAPVLDPPTLAAPAQAYTNRPTVSLTGSLPLSAVGQAGDTIRIEVSVEGAPPVLVKEEPVPSIATFTVADLPLAAGRNDFTATLVTAGGSSDPSPAVTYILDTTAPTVTISSPANGTTVNGTTVKITGSTQAQSTVSARDEANAATATAQAGADGSFTLTVPLANGTNGITITATDPAGNTGTAVVGVTKGSGVLTANLSASPYRISAGSGSNLTVTVVVTDPNGQPLPAASVQFTITVPGLAPIQPAEILTDATGTATFTTMVPPGATTGQTGLATALVTTSTYGQASARAALTVGP